MRSPWMSSTYKKLPEEKIVKFKLDVDNKKFWILLNPEFGSWVVLNENEKNLYENDNLDELKMENLYMRCLAYDDSGEIIEMKFPKPADYPSVVVVNITTTCNLKCKYCFAECEPDKGEFMKEDVMEELIKQMFKMPTSLVTFELQGGEPLCYIEGMKKFIEISEKLKSKYNKKVQYRTVTNGTLINDDFIRLVKKYDIKVGMSIDGPDELTDNVRGNGVFKKIITGIKKLKENQIEIDGAVCTLGQHNINYLEEIVEFFAENKISFKPRPVNILGRELENKLTTKNNEWAEAYKKMYYKSKELGVENFSIHIFEENVYTPIRDYICLRFPCGAAREVISVNPDGSVYPCDGFKGEDNFKIGNILNEDIKEMFKIDWVNKLRNRTSETITECSKCMFRAMCCSCCYSAYGAYGDIYNKDPHCNDRKKIFIFLIKEWIKNNMLKGSEINVY